MRHMGTLVELALSVNQVPTMVVAPVRDHYVLDILCDPRVGGMVRPLILTSGPRTAELREHAKELGFECVEGMDNNDGALLSMAVEMVLENQAQILMQGDVLNTTFRDTVMLNPALSGSSRIASHAFILEGGLPGGHFMVTDGMINHRPSLKQKIGILENALELSRAMGILCPRVAALSPIEYVNPDIVSTVDAAVLSKMGERGQFGDVIIDGPIDIDCAVSANAASRKGIASDVTGKVDIYLVPNTEAGLSFVQFLVLLGGMSVAGLVLGMRAPCIVNTPPVTREQKLVEIAMAKLMVAQG